MRRLLRFLILMSLLHGGSNDCAEVFTKKNAYHYGENITITCTLLPGKVFSALYKERRATPLVSKNWNHDTKYQVDNSTGQYIFTIKNASYLDEDKYICCCVDRTCSGYDEAAVVVMATPIIQHVNRELNVTSSTYLLPQGPQVLMCSSSPPDYYYGKVSMEFEQRQDTPIVKSVQKSEKWEITVDGSKRNDGFLIKCIVTWRDYTSTKNLTLFFDTLTTSPEPTSKKATKRDNTKAATETASAATNRINTEAVTKGTALDEHNVVVIAAAAGTGVILIVAIVVAALCLIQRRKRAQKFRKDPSNGAPVRTEDQSASTNAALLDKKEGADTADEYTYASVVPKSQRTKTVNTKIDSSAAADLYSSMPPKSERQDRLPEQQTSSDTGLMYVELDLTASAAGTGSVPKQSRDNATTEPGVEYGEIDFSK